MPQTNETSAEATSLSKNVLDFGVPFDAVDADIILRSSQSVDFRAHRIILTHASPFFGSMFTLPTSPAGGISGDEQKDGLSVIAMSEDTDTLAILLALCYPGRRSAVPITFDEVATMVHLANKFDMPGIAGYAIAGLRSLITSNPQRAYVLGWRLQSREIVRAAALETLSRPLTKDAGPDLPEYAHLPATALHQLLTYHLRCAKRLATIRSNMRWLDYKDVPTSLKSDCYHICGCTDVPVKFANEGQKRVRSWGLEYLECAQLELQACFRGSAVKGYNS